jgi:hypothetical protein
MQQGTTSKCGRGHPPVDIMTVCILCCGPQNLRKHGVSASAYLERYLQLVGTTWAPPLGQPETLPPSDSLGWNSRRRYVTSWVELERNCDGESRDQKVRTHPLPVRCTQGNRVLLRVVPRCRKRRRRDRVPVRSPGMSADGSAIRASYCRRPG